jgi:hypothetical protein
VTSTRKIVLHSLRGPRPALDALVADWIRAGVTYVGVVGVEASLLEDLIDELCVGDGTAPPYFMLTASHGPEETLKDAIALAEQLSGSYAGPVSVVEF